MSKVREVTMAQRLKWSRNARGWSLYDTSDATGISKEKVWKFENGMSLPLPAEIAALAQAFGVSSDYLLKGAQ